MQVEEMPARIDEIALMGGVSREITDTTPSCGAAGRRPARGNLHCST